MGPPSFLKASGTRLIAVRVPGRLRALFEVTANPKVQRYA